ncbi:tetratricopeptide repeat protein [Planotetraspora phitsanulokensis]|uniref:tetratricopeptide repeat protein n=1 Tax=Planotetraspora phitsanulokensis TaxID=575192 RepID=UPI001EF2C676|nr:tetratricopeptide repeat protein [Planotetraspora phitsanulokensis]
MTERVTEPLDEGWERRLAEVRASIDRRDEAEFLALALVGTGHEREAVSLALGAPAPHLPRYQRSLANYAWLLMEDR